jgi:hypothetical protein
VQQVHNPYLLFGGITAMVQQRRTTNSTISTAQKLTTQSHFFEEREMGGLGGEPIWWGVLRKD